MKKMKKQDLATLALIGISAGLLIGGCQQNQQGSSSMGSSQERMNKKMQDFQNSLSPEGKKEFAALDARHKMMAMEMFEHQCKGKNQCKGTGGCKTNEHTCAGLNGCKGQGGCAIKKPEKAVEVQYKNQMHEKRQGSAQVHTSGVSGDLSPAMQDFYKKLSLDEQKEFLALDAHHKMMAMQMAEQQCKGKNECKGMGGCRTDEHSCAGKNKCKGRGGNPVKSPDRAVEVQYNNQFHRENVSLQMEEE